MRRPFMLWLLIIALLFLAFGGIYGGVAMLVDPSGVSLNVATELEYLPVSDFILPGIFLLVFMGALPVILSIALVVRPDWPWIERFTAWSKHHWTWTGTLLLVGILAIWLLVEGLMIGFYPITNITAVTGLVILILTILPGMRNHFASV
jgi:hypothetical protein